MKLKTIPRIGSVRLGVGVILALTRVRRYAARAGAREAYRPAMKRRVRGRARAALLAVMAAGLVAPLVAAPTAAASPAQTVTGSFVESPPSFTVRQAGGNFFVD